MTDTLVQPSTTLWTERAAAWIDTRFQEQFSRYRRDYVQYLARRCRDFDVKGTATQGAFALELMRVFVEPDVVFYPLPETSSDLTRLLPRELCQGRLAIWDYMRSESLAGQNLAIVGPPGCGKTTLLKHVALTLAADRKQRRQRRAPDKLPILLVLRDLVQAIEENADLSLAQAVLDNLDRQDGPTAPQGWFARQLEQGRCLVMLDGLDEIADPNGRRQVAAWVERQMSVWHKNRFVVSSRIDGYRSNPLSGVIVLRISPFEGDQVDRLAFNWCAANVMANTHHDDAGVRTKARQEAEDMLRRIRNVPVLAVLAANPLLLTLLANVHHCSDSLPGSRAELYAKSCHVSLGERTASQGPETGLTLSQKQHVLQSLAYEMMRGRKQEIALVKAADVIQAALVRVNAQPSAESFLKMIENAGCLLVERENGVYGFAHLTFQEYLAATHVREQQLNADLAGWTADGWWRETIRFYSAQTDAAPIIRACLTDECPPNSALTLAVECLDEARYVSPEVHAQLETVLNKDIEAQDPERRRVVAEALLALRLRRGMRVSEDEYVDPAPIIHAEYQLFLDERRAQGDYRQPDHWLAYQFPVGEGPKPAVGVRPSDAISFCGWLTHRDPGPWCYRLPRVREVETDAGSAILQDSVQAKIEHWCILGNGRLVISNASRTGLTVAQLNRQIDTDFGRNRDHDRARALARALNRDRARALNLDRDLAHALSLAYSLARNLNLDLDLNRDLDLARDLALALAHNLAHDHTFAFDLNLALDLARDRDLDLALARAMARDRALAPDLDLDLARDFTRNLARDLDLDFDLARALDLDLDLDHALTVALARDLVRDLALDSNRPEESRNTLRFLRWYVRLSALLIATELLSRAQTKGSRSDDQDLDGQSGDALEKETRRLIDNYLDLYIDFATLEARVNGELAAFESIRIVRERVRD